MKRTSFVSKSKAEVSIQTANNVLQKLIPGFIIPRIKEGQPTIADEHPEVTILFCDIYDFDYICATHTPTELIDLLNEIQLTFDQLCENCEVDKIETVGKTYLACGGLKYYQINNPYHADQILKLALLMVEKVRKFTLKNGEKLQIKIGIHSGPVIAGVVGDHKPQFALVGDTVNTSSRMCSNAFNPMDIRMSEESYKLLKKPQGLEFIMEELTVKGLGLRKTYLVKQVNTFKKQIQSSVVKSLFGHAFTSNFKGANLLLKKNSSVKVQNQLKHSKTLSTVQQSQSESASPSLIKRKIGVKDPQKQNMKLNQKILQISKNQLEQIQEEAKSEVNSRRQSFRNNTQIVSSNVPSKMNRKFNNSDVKKQVVVIKSSSVLQEQSHQHLVIENIEDEIIKELSEEKQKKSELSEVKKENENKENNQSTQQNDSWNLGETQTNNNNLDKNQQQEFNSNQEKPKQNKKKISFDPKLYQEKDESEDQEKNNSNSSKLPETEVKENFHPKEKVDIQQNISFSNNLVIKLQQIQKKQDSLNYEMETMLTQNEQNSSPLIPITFSQESNNQQGFTQYNQNLQFKEKNFESQDNKTLDDTLETSFDLNQNTIKTKKITIKNQLKKEESMLHDDRSQDTFQNKHSANQSDNFEFWVNSSQQDPQQTSFKLDSEDDQFQQFNFNQSTAQELQENQEQIKANPNQT